MSGRFCGLGTKEDVGKIRHGGDDAEKRLGV